MDCPSCHSKLPDGAVSCPRCGKPLPDRGEPADFTYAAFISYRHLPRDTEVAQQVQKAIETYHLPRGVVAEQPDDSGGSAARPISAKTVGAVNGGRSPFILPLTGSAGFAISFSDYLVEHFSFFGY